MIVRSTGSMRIAKIGYIVCAAALCALGLLLLIAPDFSIRSFGMMFAVAMLVFGVVKLVGYFSRDLYRLAFQYDLVGGALLTALGAKLLATPATTVEFFCVAFGLTALAGGIIKLQIARDAKQFGIRPWLLITVLAVMTGVLGVLVIFLHGSSAQVMMRLFGAAMICEGVLNVCVAVSTVKIIRNQRPDEIEYSDGEFN